MSNLKEQIKDLHNKITAMNVELKQLTTQLQESCTHGKTVGYKDSNTGNWCPQDDSYWLKARCLDCGKRWHVDSDDPSNLYRTLKYVKVSKEEYYDNSFTGSIWR